MSFPNKIGTPTIIATMMQCFSVPKTWAADYPRHVDLKFGLSKIDATCPSICKWCPECSMVMDVKTVIFIHGSNQCSLVEFPKSSWMISRNWLNVLRFHWLYQSYASELLRPWYLLFSPPVQPKIHGDLCMFIIPKHWTNSKGPIPSPYVWWILVIYVYIYIHIFVWIYICHIYLCMYHSYKSTKGGPRNHS